MRYYDDSNKIYIEKYENHAEVVEGEHGLEQVIIPEEFMGVPVTKIFKKAFLGCKNLKDIVVADSVTSIGDFAFAMCDRLKSVTFPRKEIKLGQSLFKNDRELDRIYVVDSMQNSGEEYTREQIAKLLAATPIVMEAEYLLDIKAVGSDQWLQMWDRKLRDILSRKDDEGYHLYVLCGEEDLHFDYDQYIDYIRQKKSGLCLLRLINDYLLDENEKTVYINYLKDNTDAVFSNLCKNHGDDEVYFDICIKLGVITKDNREELLMMLNDRHPQIKAFLINSFDDDSEEDDFFASLEI